jgi:membrane-bound lytic murein transglycosylase D
MAAYNAGPVRVQRAMDKTGESDFWKLVDRKALPKETMNYVPTILALSIIGKNPEKYGFSVVSSPPLETERVSVDKPTDLRVIAEAIHVSADDLRDLNPHVLRWTTPPDDPEFQLVLPKGLSDTFQTQISTLPDNKRVLFRYHTVQRNETLSTVARKYGTRMADLAQANNLPPRKPLHVGQELIIPMSGVGPSEIAASKSSAGTKSVAATTYTVRSGDTLGKIAAKFHVTTDELKQWNHLSRAKARIPAGKKLIVRAPGSSTSPKQVASASNKRIIHKVRPGETLNQIAMTYKTSVNAILSWNKESDLAVIHPGDEITIFLGNR